MLAELPIIWNRAFRRVDIVASFGEVVDVVIALLLVDRASIDDAMIEMKRKGLITVK